MKFVLTFCLLFTLTNISAFAQVNISTDGSQPDPSAMLEVKSPVKGLLPPRVELVSVILPDPVLAPATGLTVYNTATSGTPPNNVTPGNYFWNGVRWIPVSPPQGVNIGDMLYWNGVQWVGIPVGSNGQVLTLSNGIPVWGGAQLSSIYTIPVSSIMAVSATGGGYISNDGGSPITERGICWNTMPSPTTANSKTNAGSGPGSFTASMTGLTPSATYYVRAYAINSPGTSYGNEVTFSTQSGMVTLTTTTVSSITATTAVSGGYITSDGGSAVTSRGVCWSTIPGPTTADNKTINGTGTGLFISSLSGLPPGTTLYIRAYATNAAGTFYGNELSFVTQSGIATVTTSAISSIMALTATGGGSVTSDGGATVTAKGICWSTIPGPTIADQKTINGSGTGTFSSSLTGLTAATIWYVRAYATNAVGTFYGNEVSFTTMNGVATIITLNVSSIMAQSASGGGSVTGDGGATVTSRGVCWSTSPGPTITDPKTIDGSGTGTFISSITGLNAGAIYYVRAYAVNGVGTFYGNEVSFTTQNGIILLSTTAASNISYFSATSGGTITSDGGSSVTIRGVCWSTIPGPTTSNTKTTDGSGTGTYTSSLAGLALSTTYYVRAYATNSIGTNYGNEVMVKTKDCSTFTDSRDGKSYSAVMIGNQCWMAQNLDYGSKIWGTGEQSNNNIPEKYCFDDLDMNCTIYGGLYQWGEAVQYLNGASNTTSWNPAPSGNVTGICPPGWHLSSSNEWDILCSQQGGTGIAGGKLKEAGLAHWAAPNYGATNSSGFTTLPGGYRYFDLNFSGFTTSANFWTSTQSGSSNAYYRNMDYTSEGVYQYQNHKTIGLSIRCLQD